MNSKGCSRLFICCVLCEISMVEGEQQSKGKYLLSSRQIQECLNSAWERANRLASCKPDAMFVFGGKSTFSAMDPSSFWTEPSQFLTWSAVSSVSIIKFTKCRWKNNIERKERLQKFLLDGECPMECWNQGNVKEENRNCGDSKMDHTLWCVIMHSFITFNVVQSVC